MGVGSDRIFVVNPQGVVTGGGAAAGAGGTCTFATLRALVDTLFPPLPHKAAPL